MSNSLMHRLVKGAGYCCIREMFRANDILSSSEMAERLGTTPQTISRWWRRYNEHEMSKCPECPNAQAARKPLKPLAAT